MHQCGPQLIFNLASRISTIIQDNIKNSALLPEFSKRLEQYAATAAHTNLVFVQEKDVPLNLGLPSVIKYKLIAFPTDNKLSRQVLP